VGPDPGALAEHLADQKRFYRPELASRALAACAVLAIGLLLRVMRLEREKEPVIGAELLEFRGDGYRKFELRLTNKGQAALDNCLVKVDSVTSPGIGFHPPRALRTISQTALERSGGFNLRAGETKIVPFCSRRNDYPNTPGVHFDIVIPYESEGPHCRLDDEHEYTLEIGIYGAPVPTALTFKLGIDKSNNLRVSGPL
jgi:hypothetical protein